MKTVLDKADHGGWLVVRGAQVGDQALASETRGALGDAVLLDKEKAEVIEASAEGVRVAPLRALLARAERLQVIRPPGWTAAAGKAAIARARTRVGPSYDWLGPVVPDDPRFYCTELCVDAYQGAHPGVTITTAADSPWRAFGPAWSPALAQAVNQALEATAGS